MGASGGHKAGQRGRGRLLALGVLLALGFGAAAQQAPPPGIPAAVLRITTRLVLVDVVVTDKSGRPVTGLTHDDFTLLEDGKPQTIATFSFEDIRQRAQEQPPAAPLPPNVYTNRPTYRRPPGPLTVLLLDSLNTPMQDQAYAREQMLRYLRTQLQPDQRTAILALTNDLLLLQDFTSDPRLLQAALEKFNPQRSVQLTRDDTLVSGDVVAKIADYRPQVAANLERFEQEQAAVALDSRVAITLEALKAIARATAGYPGRKNLIWVSATFPFTFTPEDNENFGAYRNYGNEIRRASSQLSDAQVAVYPVDARGLVGYSMANAGETGRSGRGAVFAGAGYGTELSRRTGQLLDTHATMRKIAEDTGGKAYINRNDIDAAVALGVADGSTYYTLGYYPGNKEWDGKLRHVEVKLARKGLQARYRRGYFALDPTAPPIPTDKKKAPPTPEEEKQQALLVALKDPIPATLITFRASVPPPEPAANARVLVGFLVDPPTLRFEEAEGNLRNCNVDFLAAAVSPEGKVVHSASETLEGQLQPEQFARVQQEGLRHVMNLELEPGRYLLRLIVRDNLTGLVGSLDVPLVLEPPNPPTAR